MAASGRRFNIELLLGVSATFLSLAALVVSIFQTKIAREQQQVSVWPHLQADYTKTAYEFTWLILNNGIGPAIIRSSRLHYKGKQYKDAYELVNEQIQRLASTDLKGKKEHVEFFYGGLLPGDVIRSDGEVKLGQIAKNETIAETMLQIVRDSSFHFGIIYSDVYGNCWQLNDNQVTQLSDCSRQ